MKIKSATFQLSAADIGACPAWAWREFAFVGRSNVGKSSLINMLCGKANLAKVSALPGKTQLLNFFLMNEAWSLVDLPGYGFAQVTKHRKYDFSVLIRDYLEQRENLAGVFVLLDSRLRCARHTGRRHKANCEQDKELLHGQILRRPTGRCNAG